MSSHLTNIDIDGRIKYNIDSKHKVKCRLHIIVKNFVSNQEPQLGNEDIFIFFPGPSNSSSAFSPIDVYINKKKYRGFKKDFIPEKNQIRLVFHIEKVLKESDFTGRDDSLEIDLALDWHNSVSEIGNSAKMFVDQIEVAIPGAEDKSFSRVSGSVKLPKPKGFKLYWFYLISILSNVFNRKIWSSGGFLRIFEIWTDAKNPDIDYKNGIVNYTSNLKSQSPLIIFFNNPNIRLSNFLLGVILTLLLWAISVICEVELQNWWAT